MAMYKQSAPEIEQSALQSLLEGLMGVCKRFEEGKEAYARSICSDLLTSFLAIEERFSVDQEATEQEVIDALRQVTPLLMLAHKLHRLQTKKTMTVFAS